MNEFDRKKMEVMCERQSLGLSALGKKHAHACLRKWFLFCDREKITSLSDFSLDCATRWVQWLEKQGYAPGSIIMYGTPPLRCLEGVQQLDPTVVHPTFSFPTAHFPQRDKGYKKSVLSEGRLQHIRDVCLEEVETISEITDATSLTPFVVLFCIRTGMNVDSVLDLGRNCVTSHLGKSGRTIRWTKHRSTGTVRDYYEPMPWGALEIVDYLSTRTEGPYLFSYLGPNGWTRWGSKHLHAWCEKNGIPRFTLKEIRPAMATLLYSLGDHDVREVQLYLGHKTLQTTLLYLSERVIAPINEAIIADAQDAMFAEWGITEVAS